MKSNSRPGKASAESVECSGPPTMLSAASPSPLMKHVGLCRWQTSRALISWPNEVRRNLVYLEALPQVPGACPQRRSTCPPYRKRSRRADTCRTRSRSATGRNMSCVMSLTRVTWRPVLSGLFVIFLIEPTDELLENSEPIRVVIDAGRTQIDICGEGELSQ